jgi:hypothetical protein
MDCDAFIFFEKISRNSSKFVDNFVDSARNDLLNPEGFYNPIE